MILELRIADLNGAVNSIDQAAGIGGLLACLDTAGTPSTGDDRTFVYSYDANGNVTQLVAATTGGNYGTLAAAYEYDAYGNTVVASGGYADDNLIRFSTRPVDPLTLLGHWPMRVLDFERGRWTTRDPASEENGANLVGWMRNQPPHAIDPLGLDWVPLNDKWDAWLDGGPLNRVLGDLGEKNPLIWFFRFLARHGASEVDTFSLSHDVAVDVFSGSSAFGNLLSTVEADAHGAAGRLRCVPGVVITGAASGDQQGSDVVEWHNLRYLSGLTYIIQQLRYDASWDCYLEKRCWCCRSSDCAYRTRVRCLLRIHGWDRYDFHGNVPSDVLQWVGGSFFINWNPTFRLRPVVRTTGCADGTPAPAGAW